MKFAREKKPVKSESEALTYREYTNSCDRCHRRVRSHRKESR